MSMTPREKEREIRKELEGLLCGGGSVATRCCGQPKMLSLFVQISFGKPVEVWERL